MQPMTGGKNSEPPHTLVGDIPQTLSAVRWVITRKTTVSTPHLDLPLHPALTAILEIITTETTVVAEAHQATKVATVAKGTTTDPRISLISSTKGKETATEVAASKTRLMKT